MKILIFSDSHGDISRMSDVIARNHADTDLIIHLGDRKSDLDEIMLDYPQIAHIGIVGNCDAISLFSLSASLEHSVTLEGLKIYITHGHHKDVKSGIYGLMREAKTKHYDIVLYGHSHIAKHDVIDGIHYFNPGSISYPRGGTSASYGVMRLCDGTAELEIKEVQ